MLKTSLLALTISTWLIGDCAAFRWPWEPVRHYRRSYVHHHHNFRVIVREPRLNPDCETIREATRELEPLNFANALHKSTKKQRQVILDCINKVKD